MSDIKCPCGSKEHSACNGSPSDERPNDEELSKGTYACPECGLETPHSGEAHGATVLPEIIYGVPSFTKDHLVWLGSSQSKAFARANLARDVIEYRRVRNPERPNLGELRGQLARVLMDHCTSHPELGAEWIPTPDTMADAILPIIEQREQAVRSIEYEALEIASQVLAENRPGAALNAVREDYPCLVSLIEQREREALKEACVAMCPLCKGVEGFSKETVLVPAYCQPETYWHALTTGRQGHDKCSASAIRNLEKLKSQPKVQAGDGSKT